MNNQKLKIKNHGNLHSVATVMIESNIKMKIMKLSIQFIWNFKTKNNLKSGTWDFL